MARVDAALAARPAQQDNVAMEKIVCLDSHTGGEPTRLVMSGFPDMAQLPLSQVVQQLRTRHDRYRAATVCEPRGSDVAVGAVLLPPRAACSAVDFVSIQTPALAALYAARFGPATWVSTSCT